MRRRGPSPWPRLLALVLLAGAGYAAWRFGPLLWRDGVADTATSRSVTMPPDLQSALGPLQVLHLLADLNADGKPEAVAVSAEHEVGRHAALLLSDGERYRLSGSVRTLQWPDQLPSVSVQDLGLLKDVLVLTSTLPGGEEQMQAFTVDTENGLTPVDYYRETAPERTDRNLLLVEKQRNVLYYYQNGNVVFVARVATGKDRAGIASVKNNYTPEGRFRISVRQANPSYTSADGKQSWKGGDPSNPLGTRWIGFSVLPGDSGWIFGVQGTSEPEKIGTWASNGSIWLANADVEKLYELVAEGTFIEIR